ncbi:substrate-binding periplasmic protein [Psychromonas hadalis]|uniref:substrate-binding periplasmic protein n=1 Tax=Psychromonas hadalis TaxID=211669 RepID=UPI0003B6D030|nr:transporter substrate-binding domain-containing protein [Psychromonas hadalis]
MLVIYNCKKILTLMVLVLFANANVNTQALKDIEILTEAYPPYNFLEGGLLKGISVDLLVAATYKMQAPVKRQEIKLQPWARVYRQALNGTHVMLFSTTRSAERENKFKWVGPIISTRIVAFAKKNSNITISSMESLKDYEVGVIRNDIGDQLITATVPKNKIQRASNADSLVRKLSIGRIQLWIYEENVARWFIKKNDFENDEFVVVYILEESELYYAFSKDVSDVVIDKLQKALEQVKLAPGMIGDTLYDDILSHYL